jgi:hypothetical protein
VVQFLAFAADNETLRAEGAIADCTEERMEIAYNAFRRRGVYYTGVVYFTPMKEGIRS